MFLILKRNLLGHRKIILNFQILQAYVVDIDGFRILAWDKYILTLKCSSCF